MRTIRRHLGLWSLAWLSCQVASLSALLPAECCAAHRAITESDQECHQPATAAGDDCPMHGANGQACPMHRGHASHTAPGQSNTASGEQPCAMRGSCNGPALALASLFSIPGVLLAQTVVPVDTKALLLPTGLDQFPIAHPSLDTPPPRS